MVISFGLLYCTGFNVYNKCYTPIAQTIVNFDALLFVQLALK